MECRWLLWSNARRAHTKATQFNMKQLSLPVFPPLPHSVSPPLSSLSPSSRSKKENNQKGHTAVEISMTTLIKNAPS